MISFDLAKSKASPRLAEILELLGKEFVRLTTLHLLLGILEHRECSGNKTIESIGISTADLAASLGSVLRNQASSPIGAPSLEPDAATALSTSISQSIILGQSLIGTNVVLFSCSMTPSPAKDLLAKLSITPQILYELALPKSPPKRMSRAVHILIDRAATESEAFNYMASSSDCDGVRVYRWFRDRLGKEPLICDGAESGRGLTQLFLDGMALLARLGDPCLTTKHLMLEILRRDPVYASRVEESLRQGDLLLDPSLED